MKAFIVFISSGQALNGVCLCQHTKLMLGNLLQLLKARLLVNSLLDQLCIVCFKIR